MGVLIAGLRERLEEPANRLGPVAHLRHGLRPQIAPVESDFGCLEGSVDLCRYCLGQTDPFFSSENFRICTNTSQFVGIFA